MIHAQTSKYIVITNPAAAVNNASFTTAEIDTTGFDYAEIYAVMGATDIALTALKVTESDTAGSGHADVTGLVYGTSLDIAGSASALPAATDDNKAFKFEIDLRGRKRYLDTVVTVGAGTTGAFVTLFIILSRAEQALASASSRGFANILRV